MTDPLYYPPNVEALLSTFLRDQQELIDLVDDRIYTVIPKLATYPLVRVQQIIDVPAGSPLWAIASTLQVDAWGGSKADAFRISNTARALIDSRLSGEYDGYGVVNGTTAGSAMDLPDEDFDPAKPRWIFSCTIYVRPIATLSNS